jgi:hypothetical protein
MTEEKCRPLTTVSIITRRLKEGKTYEDFRKAWFHSTGFGVADSNGGSNTIYSMINIFDPREVIVIGFVTSTPEKLEDGLKIEVKFRGENPLDEVIGPEIGRTFALLVAEDDFGAAGEIPYQPAAIGGEMTDMVRFGRNLDVIRKLFAGAAQERDAINEARRKAE